MTTSELRRAFDRLDATALLTIVVLGAAYGLILVKLITIAIDVYR